MLTGKPGLFGIDDISDTIQSCHVQNLVYKENVYYIYTGVNEHLSKNK